MTAVLPSEQLAVAWESWDRSPKPRSVRWRMPWLERDLGDGPTPGSTIVVGADSNVGKTFFALELLRNFAEDGPAVFLSLEDPPLELGRRMRKSGYSHPNLYAGFPDPGRVLAEFDSVCASPLKPLVVAVDYAQCVSGEKEQLDAFMRGIRERTLAHGVVSVVTSQINTLPPGVEDVGIPSHNRLKGSRTLKERADVILMMATGKERTLVVECTKAKGAPVGARARYRRAEGGRLVLATTSMEEDADE